LDNKVWSQIKRGLKIAGDYLVALFIFGIFSSIIFSIFKEDKLLTGITVFSFIIFLVMSSMMYTSMSDTAFREKRPQYDINPSPFKGFMYGFIGITPLFLVQLLYYLINVPEEFLVLKRRILQAFSAPLYWLASIISHDEWAYHVVLLVIPIIAGLGYLSGYHEFYIIKKLKIFDKLRKKQEERRKQQQPQKRK
jgi:hypothetical protein